MYATHLPLFLVAGIHRNSVTRTRLAPVETLRAISVVEGGVLEDTGR